MKTLLSIIQIFLGIIILISLFQVIFGNGNISLNDGVLLLTIIVLFFVISLKIRVKKENNLKEEVQNNLRKNDEITKNGIVINIADEIEQYSVKKCPYCQEEINKDAIKCRHCGEQVGKGFEIIADGTCVANKIQGARTSVQKTKPLHFFEKVFFGTIIVILTAYFVFYIALTW